jgi:hypothetical protein
LLHSLQFVRLEVSEQSLKIHIRKQQLSRPRVLMHLVDQQFRAPAESHSVAEETADRREFDAHRQRSHQVRTGVRSIFHGTLTLRPAFGDWPALVLFESLPHPSPPPIKQLLLRELRRPGRSSSVLRLAIGTLERNMSLARGGFMFTTARESDCLRFTRLFGAPIGRWDKQADGRLSVEVTPWQEGS